jgi:hypothetical protein
MLAKKFQLHGTNTPGPWSLGARHHKLRLEQTHPSPLVYHYQSKVTQVQVVYTLSA